MSNNPYDIRPNRQMTGWGARWVLYLILIGVALIIVLGAVGYGLGWIGAGAKIVSPENFRQQYSLAYTNYEALEAMAETVCQAQIDEANASPGTVHDQRTTQRIAYEQQYRNIVAKYDAAYDDVFKAKLVGPSDLPKQAPSLGEMKKLIARRDASSPCNNPLAS